MGVARAQDPSNARGRQSLLAPADELAARQLAAGLVDGGPTPAAGQAHSSTRGVSPCRRATTDTDAPGSSVSSTIRALSSTVQRRRPPAPVITSMRRTGRSGSSVGSSLDTSRSPFSDQDQHHHTSRSLSKGGLRTSLTSYGPFGREVY